MTRGVRVCLGLFALIVVACATTSVDGGDSDTHWLTLCNGNAGCGKEGTCFCGICTLACDPSSPCSLLAGTSCVAASSAAICAGASAAPSGLCLRGCTASGGCGAGYQCQHDTCVKPAPPLCGVTAPRNGVCGANEFLYEDQSCPAAGAVPPPDAGASASPCVEQGDGLCQKRCNSNADCKESCRPFCRVLGLADGYDNNCDSGVRVCRARDVDDCDPSTTSLR